jgi:acyl dehydratase
VVSIAVSAAYGRRCGKYGEVSGAFQAVREGASPVSGSFHGNQGLRGRYWDELEVGQEFWSSGRTVTDHDIAGFAGLSGDFNPLHMDDELGASSEFGERIPHGPLGILFALGGCDRIGLVEGVALAFLTLEWRFIAPMRVGDTIRIKVTVQQLKEVAARDRGILTLLMQLHNQRDEVVQEGEHTFMIRRRVAGGR